MLPLAAGSGFWILAIVIVILLVAVSVGYYSRSSGISHHPRDRPDEAAGTGGPSRTSSREDETEGPLDTFGTR